MNRKTTLILLVLCTFVCGMVLGKVVYAPEQVTAWTWSALCINGLAATILFLSLMLD